MGVYALKPRFQKTLRPVANRLVIWGISPNAMTAVGVVVSGVIGYILYIADSNISLLWCVPPLAFIKIASNALDGMIARAYADTDHSWGEVLNESSDRIADILIFGGLALSAYVDQTIGFVVLILILLSSFLGLLGKAAGGSRQYGGVMGKADRMLYISICAMLIATLNDFAFATYGLWFIGAGVILTAIQRVIGIKRNLTT